MKISKRLFISNISISLMTMILLAIILSSIVTQYFETERKKDLEALNENVINFMGFKRFFDIEDNQLKLNEEILKKFAFRFEDINYAVELSSSKMKDEYVSDAFYDNKLDYDSEIYKEIYKEDIMGVEYLFLSNHVELEFDGYKYDVVVLAFVKNYDSKIVVDKINITLVSAIILIGFLSFILTHYHEKKLLKPVNQLIKATEAIGKKKFNTQLDVKSGDEFETLANAINQMSQRLRSLDREQRELYENISHEVKTPLAVISGYAQSIQNNLIEDKDHALVTMISECDRLKTLLEDFIFLSKLESVEEVYNFKEEDINISIGHVLSQYENLFLIHGIDINFEPSETLKCDIDDLKLKRVISNIIANCIRYANEVISVETFRDESLHIIIKDDGKGFDQSILDDPFTRNRFNTSGGNSIGLSIMAKVIEDHNGKILLSNENGAVYHIIL